MVDTLLILLAIFINIPLRFNELIIGFVLSSIPYIANVHNEFFNGVDVLDDNFHVTLITVIYQLLGAFLV